MKKHSLWTSLLVLFLVPSGYAKDPLYLNTRHPVPGHIEFENHVATGGGSVPTVDAPRYEAGQGEILRGIRNGSRANYSVTVAQAGTYELKIRYARSTGGRTPVLQLRRGNTTIKNIDIPGTGSSNVFQTITTNVQMAAGDQTITARWVDGNTGSLGGVSFNWMAFRLLPSTASPQFRLFVSPSGNDSANGSQGAPYKTLKRAFDRLASIRQSNPNHGPITIFLRGGYHEITSTINLGGAHQGTARGPVTVRPFGNEAAIIGGGRKIPNSSLRKVTDQGSLDRLKPNARGKVYRARLAGTDWERRFPGNGNLGMVSYNGVALELAKIPNRGLINANNANSSGEFTSSTPINGGRWAREFNRSGDMFIIGHVQSDEFEERLPVTSVLNNGRISFGRNFDKFRGDGRKLRVVNVLAELDMPGEWYYDKVSKDFYIWPVASLNLNPDIRAGGNFILIRGGSCHYWTLRDLIIQDNGGTATNTGAIDMIALTGDNMTIAGNTFRNSNSRSCARFNGDFNRITSNDFYDCQVPFNVEGGDRSFPVRPSQTEFTNNYIRDIYNRGYGGGGISGAGVRCANNLIHNVQGGMTYSRSTDTLMELNEWYDSGYENGDWNVAYVGATYANWGTVVRHNFVHNMVRPPGRRRAGAFRGDDGTAGLNFYGNILYKTADYGFAGTRIATTFTNNIVAESNGFVLSGPDEGYITGGTRIDTQAEINAEWAAQQQVNASTPSAKRNYIYNAEQFLGTDFWEKPHFAYKYPVAKRGFDQNAFDSAEMELRRNYVSNVDTPLQSVRPSTASVRDYISNSENPISIPLSSFRDVSTLDLRFNSGFNRVSGFSNIPFDEIGLIRDGFRTTLPHKPTYRAGAKLKWNFSRSNSRGRSANPNTDNNVYPQPNFNRQVVYDAGTYRSPLFQAAILLAPQTNGTYGWNNNSGLNATDRNRGNNLNRDVIFSSQTRTFERIVENGDWYGLVTFGDTVARDRMSVRAEGGAFASGNQNFNTSANQYVNKLVKARVTDGKFSIEISDSGGNNSSWSISRIIVQNAPFSGQSPVGSNGGGGNSGGGSGGSGGGGGNSGGGGSGGGGGNSGGVQSTGAFVNQNEYRWDFGTATSPVFGGYQRITHQTGQGFVRWTNTSGLSSRDRGAGQNALNRDFVFSSETRTLRHELSSGRYRVTLNLFDANGVHENMRVRAEGVNRLTNQTYGGSTGNQTRSFQVTVTDGALDLEFSDQGGPDPNWVLNRIVVTRIGNASNTSQTAQASQATQDNRLSFVSPSPANNASLNIGANVPIQVTSTVPVDNMRLFVNNQFVRQENRAPYEWAVGNQNDPLLTNLADGTYTIRVVAALTGGGTAERTIVVNVGR